MFLEWKIVVLKTGNIAFSCVTLLCDGKNFDFSTTPRRPRIILESSRACKLRNRTKYGTVRYGRDRYLSWGLRYGE